MTLKKILSVLLSLLLICSCYAGITSFAAKEFDNIEDAGRYLRQCMSDRADTVELDLRVPVSAISGGTYFNDLIDDIEDQALLHTGVPTEGDYINNHYEQMDVSLAAQIFTEDCIVSLTFYLTYRTSKDREKDMNKKVAEVVAGLGAENMNDYEKVVAVHDYILDHVTYDHEHVGDDSYLPQFTACAALIEGTAVCQGYATLMYRLLLELGVDCRVVTGTVAGEGHGWNIVKLGDLYYNIDATFDDDENGSSRAYFLKSAANFEDHLRDPEFLTQRFIDAYPMADEDYAGDGSELSERAETTVPPEVPTDPPTATDPVIPTTQEPPTETETVIPTTQESPTATETIIPTTQEPPTETQSVIPTTQEPPTETETVIPTTQEFPTQTESVVPTTQEPPTETETVIPTTQEPPTQTESVVPTTQELPTQTESVIPTTQEPPAESSTQTTAPGPEKPGIPAGLSYGDANLDGKLRSDDARRILRHAARIALFTDERAMILCDMNGDGKVNASDARLALRAAAKMDPAIPYAPSANGTSAVSFTRTRKNIYVI